MQPCGLPRILHQRESEFHRSCRFLVCKCREAKLTLGAVDHASGKSAWVQGCSRVVGVGVANAPQATARMQVGESIVSCITAGTSFCRVLTCLDITYRYVRTLFSVPVRPNTSRKHCYQVPNVPPRRHLRQWRK
jgi:hypothetical protein